MHRFRVWRTVIVLVAAFFVSASCYGIRHRHELYTRWLLWEVYHASREDGYDAIKQLWLRGKEVDAAGLRFSPPTTQPLDIKSCRRIAEGRLVLWTYSLHPSMRWLLLLRRRDDGTYAVDAVFSKIEG